MSMVLRRRLQPGRAQSSKSEHQRNQALAGVSLSRSLPHFWRHVASRLHDVTLHGADHCHGAEFDGGPLSSTRPVTRLAGRFADPL